MPSPAAVLGAESGAADSQFRPCLHLLGLIIRQRAYPQVAIGSGAELNQTMLCVVCYTLQREYRLYTLY